MILLFYRSKLHRTPHLIRHSILIMNTAKLVLVLYVLLCFIKTAFPFMIMMDFRGESLERNILGGFQDGTERLIHQAAQENLYDNEPYLFDVNDNSDSLFESLVVPPMSNDDHF